MTVAAADLLREKARAYELSAESAREREQPELAVGWAAVAVALLEVAATLEEAA